jgi:hypothetical protein
VTGDNNSSATVGKSGGRQQLAANGNSQEPAFPAQVSPVKHKKSVIKSSLSCDEEPGLVCSDTSDKTIVVPLSNCVVNSTNNSKAEETTTTMNRTNNHHRKQKNSAASLIINHDTDKVDKEEKEFRRASQEINRSNRRLIKQSFQSDVLEIEESKETKGPPVSEDQKTVNPEEDDWDTMFDDNGDCLDPKLMDELTMTVGKVTIETPKMDYKVR